jgi:hypothetical protein
MKFFYFFFAQTRRIVVYQYVKKIMGVTNSRCGVCVLKLYLSATQSLHDIEAWGTPQ